MTQTIRYSRLAGLTVALVALLLGCKPAVTAQNAMPDDPNMSSGQKRQAMIQWHQQHDKPQTAGTAQSGQ